MSEELTIFFSNRIEKLYERLKESLFLNSLGNPFVRRMIVVPSPAIKSWLMMRMARDPDLYIAAGVEVTYLDRAMDVLRDRQAKFPNGLELALAIELEIRKVVKGWKELDFIEQKIWEPLLSYLKVKGLKSRKSERRIISLSEKLADLFSQYGTYGGEMVREWELKPANWQGLLWKRLFCGNVYTWSYPARELSYAPTANLQVHLFSVSFLAEIQHAFLCKVAKHLPVCYYLLSPCQAFWSDQCSDREKRALLAYWKGRGVAGSQQAALEEYLRERNPLLANFGRLGREMAGYVDEGHSQVEANYVLPRAVENFPEYGELVWDDLEFDTEDLTLLKAVQADMVLLRNPEKTSKVDIASTDNSLQLHVAASRMREVEVIYNLLMTIIEKHLEENPITPSDIIVMAPNIMEYEPFIKSVFGSSESQLDFQVMDLHMPSQDLLVQGFLHLLSLPFGRWDAASLMQLLDYPDFQERHHFKVEDVQQIRDWVEETNVRWGEDAGHRNELLLRDHCEREMVECSATGTWDEGMGRLLFGLVMTAGKRDEVIYSLSMLPFEGIETTQGELLSKWIRLLKSLKADLKPLQDGTQLTLSDWAAYLRCLAKAYFGVDDSDKEQNLITHIEAFRKAAHSFSQDKFSFSSIRKHLEVSLKKQRVGYRETYLQTVRFCSMVPMRAIPAQAIVLMGMNEGAFPRTDDTMSLNMMLGNPKADYFPSQVDFDRYLFLEALLSARRYFLISYVGYASDSKEIPPSLLVTELVNYVDKAFTTSIPVQKHPFQAFNKAYFESNSPLKSYSMHQYKMAEAYYLLEKKPNHRFLPEFSVTKTPLKAATDICLNIKQLSSFASNPLKTYFNNALGIYLREEDERIKVEDDFIVSPLELSRIKKMALKQPLERVIDLAEKQGWVPPGAFKGVSLEKIRKETDILKSHLIEFGVKAQELMDIEFSDRFDRVEQTPEGHWQVPYLEIPYRGTKVKIVGKLTDVTPKGLMVHHKDDKVDVFKAWPQFLVYCCAVRRFGLPCEQQLLFAKSGKGKSFPNQDPEPLLIDYLDYYFLSLENASPLIPEIAYDLIHQEPEGLEQKIGALLNNDFSPIYNNYLTWISRGDSALNSQSMSEHWKQRGQHLFSDILKQWYPVKKGADDDNI